MEPDEHPLARALKGEVIRDWEYLVERVDGSVVRSRVNAQPLMIDGEVSGAVYIGRDVTRERELEAACGPSGPAGAIGCHRRRGSGSGGHDCVCQDEAGAWSAAVGLISGPPWSGSLALSSDDRGNLRLVAWGGEHDFSDFPVAQDPFSMPTAIQALSRGSAVIASVDGGRPIRTRRDGRDGRRTRSSRSRLPMPSGDLA